MTRTKSYPFMSVELTADEAEFIRRAITRYATAIGPGGVMEKLAAAVERRLSQARIVLP